MKDYHINIFYSEEDGGYIADIPDLRFCSAFGHSQQEALAEVLIAKGSLARICRGKCKAGPGASLPPLHLPNGGLATNDARRQGILNGCNTRA